MVFVQSTMYVVVPVPSRLGVAKCRYTRRARVYNWQPSRLRTAAGGWCPCYSSTYPAYIPRYIGRPGQAVRGSVPIDPGLLATPAAGSWCRVSLPL